MNPYRNRFYQKQAQWHGHTDAAVVCAGHEQRAPYYEWYTRDWLPTDKATPILDIACGSGFVHFLKQEGYTNVTGIDLDRRQIELARELGLNCHCQTAQEFLSSTSVRFGLVTMMDVLEHFENTELLELMDMVSAKLDGRLIVSVPNAESPAGLYTRYSDITHEQSFSSTSLSELFFCHGLKTVALRDPWPAPVSLSRRLYRLICLAARMVEAARMRLLGLAAPKIWSSVIWAMAEKNGPELTYP
jgi:2-polyprenyl-3-methyl-5-hydroxy-6-metoxy-1,4-benzoquinol methylase